LDICRCTNGFCICVVKDIFGLWIFVIGHVVSYFVDHSGGENGVQETFGVDISVEIFDGILFWRSTRWFIWTSTSGVLGDWVESKINDDICVFDEHESLFGRWIGPGPCCGNGNGSILKFKIEYF
jgi:hypothetical protein